MKREDDPAPQRLPKPDDQPTSPASLPAGDERLEAEGRRHQQVGPLDVSREAEEDGREHGATREPRGQTRGHEAETEQLRRGPEEIERRHRTEEEGEHDDDRGPRSHAPPPEHAVSEPDRESQHQRVRDEEAACPEQCHERCRRQRIADGLGKVEPSFVGSDASHPRESALEVEGQPSAGALDEEALRPVGILPPHALEVARVEAHVQIAGEAPRHPVVGRPVTPELSLRDDGKVGRHGQGNEDHPDRDEQHPSPTLGPSGSRARLVGAARR